MEYIYIMSCQRGQGSPEIFSIWFSYEKALTAYYEYNIADGFSRRSDDNDYFFMYLIDLIFP